MHHRFYRLPPQWLRSLWTLALKGRLGRRLLANAGGTFALSLAARLFALGTSILLARLLGPDGYGIYASSVAILVFLTLLATLGLPVLVIRLFAEYRVTEEWALMRGLLRGSHRVVLAAALALSVAGFGVVWLVADSLKPERTLTLWWLMALLPIMALGRLRLAALRGLNHVVAAQIPESLVAPGLLVLLLTAYVVAPDMVPKDPSASVAAALRFVAELSAFLLGYWLLRRLLPTELKGAAIQYDAANWGRRALPLLFVGSMTVLNLQADVVMLAWLDSSAAAGIYHVAARGAELAGFSLLVVYSAMQPSIAELHATGQKQRLQRLMTVSARVTMLLTIAAAAFLSAFAELILSEVFGPEFGAGALCLAILCAGQVVSAACGSVEHLLTMTGHEKQTALALGAGAATNLMLNALLIPRWGIEGAAVATALGLSVWNVTLVLLARRHLGIDSTALGMHPHANCPSACVEQHSPTRTTGEAVGESDVRNVISSKRNSRG